MRGPPTCPRPGPSSLAGPAEPLHTNGLFAHPPTPTPEGPTRSELARLPRPHAWNEPRNGLQHPPYTERDVTTKTAAAPRNSQKPLNPLGPTQQTLSRRVSIDPEQPDASALVQPPAVRRIPSPVSAQNRTGHAVTFETRIVTLAVPRPHCPVVTEIDPSRHQIDTRQADAPGLPGPPAVRRIPSPVLRVQNPSHAGTLEPSVVALAVPRVPARIITKIDPPARPEPTRPPRLQRSRSARLQPRTPLPQNQHAHISASSPTPILTTHQRRWSSSENGPDPEPEPYRRSDGPPPRPPTSRTVPADRSPRYGGRPSPPGAAPLAHARNPTSRPPASPEPNPG